MSAVRANLVAAKALIDTPEKWVAFGERPVLGAIANACADDAAGDRDYIDARDALRAANGGILVGVSGLNFAQSMALFDRAIAAQPTPVSAQ